MFFILTKMADLTIRSGARPTPQGAGDPCHRHEGRLACLAVSRVFLPSIEAFGAPNLAPRGDWFEQENCCDTARGGWFGPRCTGTLALALAMALGICPKHRCGQVSGGPGGACR